MNLFGMQLDLFGNNADAPKCMSTLHADGIRTVCVASAVSYIFKHTSYKKATKKKVA